MEIVLATMGRQPTAEQLRCLGELPNVRHEHGDFKLEWMDDPWPDVDEAGRWLLDLQHRHGPDIIHLNGYSHAVLPWQAPVLVVGHSCVLSWWRAVKGQAAPEPQWTEYRRRVRAGLHAAQLVATPTCAMLRTLCDNYGTLPHATVVVNGRSGTRFWSSTKTQIYFSAARLWDEAKNLDLLRRVENLLPWPLHVAGEIGHPPGGNRAIGMKHHLGLLETPQLANWLSRAAVFVLPAKYEPFGLSVLEAALSGCALVLSDIESLREIWGDAAIYVSPDDADALRMTLTALAQDEQRRRQLAGAAMARARQLNPQHMADGYLALYRRLLRDRKTPCPQCLSLPPRAIRPPDGANRRPRVYQPSPSSLRNAQQQQAKEAEETRGR